MQSTQPHNLTVSPVSIGNTAMTLVVHNDSLSRYIPHMAIAQSDPFLVEYSSEDALRRYSKRSAGRGINHLLEHDYGALYLNALEPQLSAGPHRNTIRVLEFGCGAGMNLIYLASLLHRRNISVDAYGTDFSEMLIQAANSERDTYVAPDKRHSVKFLVARNECLTADMSAALNADRAQLLGSFHLIIGVNTFRYCHRLGKARECATDIFDLLTPGGVCVMIDMNRKFPVFRSLIRDRFTKPHNERYLPSLEEYGAPFAAAGFEILQQKTFCWIPHSAGPVLLRTCQLLTPALNLLIPSFAMRSLVVARKRK